MYEELAPRRNGAFRDVFLVVLVGFVILSLPDWLEPYNTVLDLPYATAIYEFFVFFAMGLGVYSLIRLYSAEYKYTLVDSTLTVVEKIGARETVVAQLTVTGESRLIPLTEAGEYIKENNIKPRKISYGVSDKNRAYLITFPMKNGKNAMIFQPSVKFVEILQQIALDKQGEM